MNIYNIFMKHEKDEPWSLVSFAAWALACGAVGVLFVVLGLLFGAQWGGVGTLAVVIAAWYGISRCKPA